ncbi:MAG: hypothetical protein KC776_37675 [Myxococcales bacterium]|nr:hypothetical protein [Myxococcales bacterium]
MALGCAALSLLLAVSCSSDDGSAGPPHTLVDASSDGNAEASLDAGLSDGWADGPDPDAAAEDAGVDAGPCGSEVPTVGATKNPRGSNSPAFARPSYDYAPSVMHDGVYRMWWCGGIAGDHILYAEAASLDGPWHAHGSTAPNSYDDVFSPTGVVGDFDGAHTCDPSVVRVNGTYVMFYGGLGKDGTPNNTTRIGVAQSDDGFSWTRLNGGKPIIGPAQSLAGKPNTYGAGQPSAFYKDGKYYLAFTDTSAAGANPGNGAGQFVLRSSDPTFQSGVEELGATGFAPQQPNSKRDAKLTEAFSPDWTYAPGIDRVVMVLHGGAGKEEVRVFGPDLKQVGATSFDFEWHEGPGIVKRPDGQLDPTSACDGISIDVMRAVGSSDVNSWDLAHSGIDIAMGTSCECIPWPKVLEGTLLVSPGKPLTLVRGGERLQFASAAPAARLARTSLDVPESIFYAVPFGASMQSGAPVVGATGRPAAFKLDQDRLWPASCLELITDNGSSIASISVAEFDAYPMASSLYCLK